MTGGWGFVQRSLSIFYTENLIIYIPRNRKLNGLPTEVFISSILMA